ncbi:MAG: hypothetical protein LBD06_06875 [Candidatus Accumulibacter sp.]|nr:hypothetical protein [Accumulibacter sp.]
MRGQKIDKFGRFAPSRGQKTERWGSEDRGLRGQKIDEFGRFAPSRGQRLERTEDR